MLGFLFRNIARFLNRRQSLRQPASACPASGSDPGPTLAPPKSPVPTSSDGAGERALRSIALGNDRVVDSLIEYERKRNPMLCLDDLARDAAERWRVEVRSWR